MNQSIGIRKDKEKINIESFYKESSNFNNFCYSNILIIYINKKPNNVIIASDIIWFSQNIAETIRELISKDLKIPVSSVVLNASHTHGTPNPEKNILTPVSSSSFNSYLIASLKDLFKKVKEKKLINVEIKYRSVENTKFSISRRRKALRLKPYITYDMQSLPNSKILIDTNIDIVDFKDAKNKTICSIIRLSCHPVTALKNTYGPDYIGYIRKYFKKENIDIFFMQGFCGDIRPKLIYKENTIKDFFIKLIIGKRFRKPEKEDSKNIAKLIYDNIKTYKKAKTFNIKSLSKSHKLLLKVPLQDNTFLKYPLEINVWDWGNILFIFINAEVLSKYNIVNYNNKKVLCVGYTNGMIGYLPTKEEINKGGYEIDKCRKAFQWSARIDESFSQNVRIKIKAMLDSSGK